jgi:AcrR family transcriptional regulator
MVSKKKVISAQETHAQVTREKLLETAIQLVNKEGMRYLTIRNICDEAGISTGSFYNLFEGKDDLIAYYLQSIFTSYKQQAEEVGTGYTSLERIVLIYRFYIKCVMETGIEFITGLYSSVTNPAFNFMEREPEEELVLGQVRLDLEEGIKSNEIKSDVDVDEALLRIAIIITGSIYYWCAFDGRIDLAYQADSMLQNYLLHLSTDANCTFNVEPITRNDGSLI